jgi:spermidine dehydrogenase
MDNPHPSSPKSADPLGLDTNIERRDFLNSTLIAAGAMLMNPAAPQKALTQEEWTGYGGVGDYANSNGNTYGVMMAGHQIRDHAFDPAAQQVTDTGETFDCVVVGGGISGLAAALFFARSTNGQKTCLVLDNHPVFGGEAKRNEFNVEGQRLIAHQGSAACFPPLNESFLQGFYDSVGIRWPQFKYQKWTGPQTEVSLRPRRIRWAGPRPGYSLGKDSATRKANG